MRKYLPVFISLLILFIATFIVINLKNSQNNSVKEEVDIGEFERKQTCAIQPLFLSKLKIPQPIAVDLSQQQYRGIAFLFGPRLQQTVHPKSWTRFDHFSSYILDPQGNTYLTPMPYITIEPKTFEFQRSIYKLNTHSGELSIWKTIDEVKAGASNPFGFIALDYDCDDDSLWVSAIDETDYRTKRGVIYHIDVQSREILQKVEGFDALSLKLLETTKGKYLLAGSAREAKLYAFEIKDKTLSNSPKELLELSSFNERVRKIDVMAKNNLRLQTIPFAYTLVAETGEGSTIRENYNLNWNPILKRWEVKRFK